MKGVVVDRRDVQRAIVLIDELQEHITSAIEMLVIPGTLKAMKGDGRLLNHLRRKQTSIEATLTRLQRVVGGNPCT